MARQSGPNAVPPQLVKSTMWQALNEDGSLLIPRATWLTYVALKSRISCQGASSETMDNINSIATYLRTFATELGERILESFPPLHGAQDPPSPLLSKLLRRPYPAQAVAISGIVRRLAEARAAAVVAECGTGKTLISLASLYVASGGKRFVALAMVPSHFTPSV